MKKRSNDDILLDPKTCNHQWKEMHHYEDPLPGYGPELWHYCPTGFKTCKLCLTTELNDSPDQCQRWGEWGNTKCKKCNNLLVRISYPSGCFGCTDAGYCKPCNIIYREEDKSL